MSLMADDEIKHREKRAYQLDEFCDAHGIGRTKCYGEMRAGRLKARRIGKRIIITSEDAEQWLADLPAA